MNMHENAWIWMNMNEYEWIWTNMNKYEEQIRTKMNAKEWKGAKMN